MLVPGSQFPGRTAARLLLQKKAIAADNAAVKQLSSGDVGITLRLLFLHAGARQPVPRAHGSSRKRLLLLILLLQNSLLVEMLA